MKKYIEFVKNNRKKLILIFIIINLTVLAGIFQIRINSDYKIFMPEKSKYKAVLDKMNTEYPGSQQLIFLIESDKTEFDLNLVSKLTDLQKFISSMKKVRYVTGPIPEKIITGNRIIKTDNMKAGDIKVLKDYYYNLETLSPVTMKHEKLYATYEVFPGSDFTNNDINKIENYLNNTDFKFYATGDIYMQQKIMDYIWIILFCFPPVVFLLILTVFRSQMRSVKATFLSVLPAGIGALWTMGLIGWIGKEVSIITVLAPIFTIVIGSADGLHFISHFQDETISGKDRKKCILETLKMVGMPMIITTVTSIAGFLSLIIINNSAIKDLAVSASTGILLAGTATWFVLPLILTGSLSFKKKPRKHANPITCGIRKLWGIPSIVILVVLIITALIGTRYVTTEFNQLMIYKKYTKVYKSFNKIMDINNGSIPLFIYIKTDKNPLDPEYAHNILGLEKKLIESGYAGKAFSPYDLIAIINSSIINKSTPEYPENHNQLNMLKSMIANMDGSPVENLINIEKKSVRIMVFPTDLTNKTLDNIQSIILDFNKSYIDLDTEITGTQFLLRELNADMLQNQLKTVTIAFTLIFILLFISLKKVKPSIISLLPIISTVIILFGFLGLSGLSINIITITIFGITIGVGIDYAVHFTSVWMSFKRRGFNSNKAAEKAYKYTSRPILANAFGIATGLSALLLSPLRIHLFVSEMMWVSMLSGVFLSLSFLPTVLRKVN